MIRDGRMVTSTPGATLCLGRVILGMSLHTGEPQVSTFYFRFVHFVDQNSLFVLCRYRLQQGRSKWILDRGEDEEALGDPCW